MPWANVADTDAEEQEPRRSRKEKTRTEKRGILRQVFLFMTDPKAVVLSGQNAENQRLSGGRCAVQAHTRKESKG